MPNLVTIEEVFNKYGIFFPQLELEIKVLPPQQLPSSETKQKTRAYRPNNADLCQRKWSQIDEETSALLYQEGLGDTFKAVAEWEREGQILTLLNVYRCFYPSYVTLLQSKELSSDNAAQLWENCIYIKKQQLKQEKSTLLNFLTENFSLPPQSSGVSVLIEREIEKLEEIKINLFSEKEWKDVEKIWALEDIIDTLGEKPERHSFRNDFRIVDKNLAETLNQYFVIPYLEVPEIIDEEIKEIYDTLSQDQSQNGLSRTPVEVLKLSLELV